MFYSQLQLAIPKHYFYDKIRQICAKDFQTSHTEATLTSYCPMD